ncbi:MAG: peptidylprolyl isomerase [Bacilli bacterium]|nr:peptidylprolyl isomerase [Bacilli bacterium]
MKKILVLLIIGVLFISGCSMKDLFVRENEKIEYLKGKINVEMNVKDYGVIRLELDADTAPITVTNFVNLVKEGFYDGLTFHRIISNFMIQGGDPEHTGLGGSDEPIKGEFKSNGVENNISHTRGVISMARTPYDNDSASSQFFIVHQDSTFLDGDYAAFGHVTEGIEIVDQIVANVNPTEEDIEISYENQPVITSIKVIE